MTNVFSHHYQLDESTFIFRDVRSDFYFLFDFSMKFLCVLRRHIWGYAVCLCSIKRTPGLYEPHREEMGLLPM